MKKFKYLLTAFLFVPLFSCGDDSECVICTMGNTDTEVCEWDETSVTIGTPGAAAAQIFENTTIAAEVAELQAAGFVCNQ